MQTAIIAGSEQNTNQKAKVIDYSETASSEFKAKLDLLKTSAPATKLGSWGGIEQLRTEGPD